MANSSSRYFSSGCIRWRECAWEFPQRQFCLSINVRADIPHVFIFPVPRKDRQNRTFDIHAINGSRKGGNKGPMQTATKQDRRMGILPVTPKSYAGGIAATKTRPVSILSVSVLELHLQNAFQRFNQQHAHRTHTTNCGQWTLDRGLWTVDFFQPSCPFASIRVKNCGRHRAGSIEPQNKKLPNEPIFGFGLPTVHQELTPFPVRSLPKNEPIFEPCAPPVASKPWRKKWTDLLCSLA